ncbi:hypothetical protein N431DRAFT_465912 [Stipitochalara longipes BDJ]|nr:hypothetical protein N431DRAFT_465912 [Stipitochalara longipes BDJ]
MAYSTNSGQLQEQLTIALRDKQQLQSHIDTLNLIAPAQAKCYFLETIPIEVRNHTYGYLLVNPDLASLQIIPTFWFHEPIHQYDLSPAILETCKQINEEGSLVLYGRNIFIAGFRDYGWIYSLLSRYKGNFRDTFFRLVLIWKHPAFSKVKHWKVILDANERCFPPPPSESFVKFCREISDNTPRSMKILILPRGYTWSESERSYYSHRHLMTVLEPLSLFRNIRNIELGGLPLGEASTYLPPPDANIPCYDFQIPCMKSMKTLRESCKPIVRVWKMYQKLINYAQSFERNHQFKNNMKPIWGAGNHYIECQAQNRVWAWNRDLDEQMGNPFTKHPVHPVEAALLLGSIGSETNDIEKFLEARSSVLVYLEPQYQRISAIGACARLYTSPSALEEYAQSFVRDVPLATRVTIRKIQHKFNSAYASLEREVRLKHLSSILENDIFDARAAIEFAEVFKQAMDDMDKQYLEIRKARKQLFECDDGDYERTIDPEMWKCDEMVVWTVEESEMLPRNLPRAQRSQHWQHSNFGLKSRYPDSDSDSDSNSDPDPGSDFDDLSSSNTREASPTLSEETDDFSADDQMDSSSTAESGEVELDEEEEEEWNGIEDTDLEEGGEH